MTPEQIKQRTALIVEPMSSLPGGLLPILHAVQDQLGYVPEESVPVIAKGLNLSRAEVHGVVSFYHHFRRAPAGKRTLFVCRSEACQAVGGRELEAHAKRTLGVDWHETSADGALTLEPIYCLGNCACAPAVMLDEQLIGRATPARVDALIDEVRSED